MRPLTHCSSGRHCRRPLQPHPPQIIKALGLGRSRTPRILESEKYRTGSELCLLFVAEEASDLGVDFELSEFRPRLHVVDGLTTVSPGGGRREAQDGIRDAVDCMGRSSAGTHLAGLSGTAPGRWSQSFVTLLKLQFLCFEEERPRLGFRFEGELMHPKTLAELLEAVLNGVPGFFVRELLADGRLMNRMRLKAVIAS